MTMATRSIPVSSCDRIDSNANTPGGAFNKVRVSVVVTFLNSTSDLNGYKLLSLGTETVLI
jgi:hypothetical protein